MFDTLIINPMTNLLVLLYQLLFNNFALAVAVFTILTRLLTLPFTIKQQRSTQAMQQIQPELEKLKEKYGNDREKMSQAQMELYRKHGINPLGGCLPLLLTMPIMLGLYQAIIASLAQTPLQLLDLSQRFYSFLPQLTQLIPLNNKWLGINLGQPPGGTQPIYAYVLIVLVVATGYLQQKMISPQTQTSSDSSNQMAGMSQSMMYTMPLMFGFFALTFASGLSIYFIISNLVGMVQYWAMNRMGLRASPSSAGTTSDKPPKPAAIESKSKAKAKPKAASAGKTKKKRK